MTKRNLPEKNSHGTWIQTERAAHEAWAQFLGLKGALAASRVMHLLLARVGDYNAVVISQQTMADLLNVSRDTVKRAVSMLSKHRWIEIRQIGDRGTVNAYVVNRNVGWSGPRDGIRYALFSATVVVSDQEQPDKETLHSLKPLRQLPTMYPGEQQLPTGPGLEPPSQPALPGMEPDLPSRQMDIEDFMK